MKQFILKIMGFAILVLASVFFVFSLADGKTDWFYHKFTTPIQTSLIIGSSLAAQGLQPEYLNKGLERTDIYNYAFTVPSTPFGKNYFESIKKKIDTKSRNGIFILDVNPHTLIKWINKTTQKEIYTEPHKLIGEINNVSQDPNLEYLLKVYDKKYIEILINRFSKLKKRSSYIQDDGWLHINFKSDTVYSNRRIKEKVLERRKIDSVINELSAYRMDYLIKLIQFLKKHGKVYLVKIPIHNKLLEIENELFPNFDSEMQGLAKRFKLSFINMSNYKDRYYYNDGIHMDALSSKQFSIDLATRIKALQDQ